MTRFRQNLALARGHIAMILGLILGTALVFWLEGISLGPTAPADPLADFAEATPLPLAEQRPLTEAERQAAAIAWRYFQNNTQPETGLVGSVHGYPSTTMWETGSLIIAILSAERIGLIAPSEAKARLSTLLDSLARLPLLPQGLPNKVYDTRSLAIVDYANKPSATGLGWSALDMGRLMSGLAMIERSHPELAPSVEKALSGWHLSRLVKAGELNGANFRDGTMTEQQEGRIGYEQYAARAFLGFGLDASRALDVTGHVMAKPVEGVAVPVDSRLNRNMVPAMTTSEPYLMDGLEYGFDWRSQMFAAQVYRAQEGRHARTGTLTAVSEGHINQAPYFAYATVWGGGQDWAVLTFQGERLDSKRVLSTKAAFGWDALYDTPYTDKLMSAVADLNDPAKGWFEGRYEIDGKPNDSVTANTNALILTALAFRQSGPLLKVGQ